MGNWAGVCTRPSRRPRKAPRLSSSTWTGPPRSITGKPLLSRRSAGGGRGVAHVPLHALSVADFPTVRAEVFDEHVVPTDVKTETRPRAPVNYVL
eukprot:3042530-Heterocapsa_arctica.AAC.1